MNANKKIIVIGAGLGGLTAAYRLQQAGYSVQVLEQSSRPGGRVKTVEQNGYLFDVGADALTDGYTEYLQLAEDIGFTDQMAFSNPEVAVIRDGKVIAFDPGSMLAMALTPLLSLGAKLRSLKGMISCGKIAKQLSTPRMYELAAVDDPNLNAAQLSRRIFGQEAADYLIDPVTKMYNGTSADKCSALDMYISMSVASDKPMAVKGGQDVFPQAIAKHLNISYNTTVNEISHDDAGQVNVTIQDADGNQQQITADGCVIATMYDKARAMCPEFADACENTGEQVMPMALIKIQLAYKASTNTPAFLIQSPDVEDPDLYCLFLDHNKCPDRAPAGCSLVTAYTTNEKTLEYLHRPDDEMIAWARERAEKYLPELTGHFDFAVISRWPYMAQVSQPGDYRKAAADYDNVSRLGNIRVACDIFTKGNQETAVAMGNVAAKNLIAQLSG